MLLHRIDTNDALKISELKTIFLLHASMMPPAKCCFLSSNAFCLQQTLLQLKTKNVHNNKEKNYPFKFSSDHFFSNITLQKFSF